MGNYILQLLRASRERQWLKSRAVPNGAGSACHKFQIALLPLKSHWSKNLLVLSEALYWYFLLHSSFSFK